MDTNNPNPKIAQKILPKGLNEEIIRQISATKNEPDWLLNWRLRAFQHWQKMTEPKWGKLKIKPINYQKISYQAVPKNFNPFTGQKTSPKIQKIKTKIDQIQTQITATKKEIQDITKKLKKLN